MRNVVAETYDMNLVDWQGDAPMQHASGIWGRPRLLERMRGCISAGETVVDLGCGAGYITAYIAHLVGNAGHVFGYDITPEFIRHATSEYRDRPHLRFSVCDVSKTLPHGNSTVDVFVSCMLLQNLREQEIGGLFAEIARCLKSNGEAVFLALHPDIWVAPWKLNFIEYDETQITAWRQKKCDDLLIRGWVSNFVGGEKPVFMFTHSEARIKQSLHTYGLEICESAPIHIDPETAERLFGHEEGRVYPVDPVFWIFTVRKI